MQRLCSTLGLFCLAIFGAPVFAQAPFFAAEDTPKAAESTEQPPEGPLVEQLLEHSRRGDIQLSEAIGSLSRIRNWPRVDQLLSEVNRKNIAVSVLAEMQAKIGSDQFLRIRQAGLSDAANAGLDKIAAASIAQAESPGQLQQAIAGLASNNLDTKFGAARVLLAGGNSAIKELATEAVKENPKVDRDLLLQAMLRIGPGGNDALAQLALYGTPSVRHQALRALARINRGAVVPELLTALHGRDSSDSEIATARNHLVRLGEVPGVAVATATLAMDLKQKSQRAQLIPNDVQIATLWNVSEDRKSVNHQSVRAVHAAYREVADACARLRRVGNLSSSLASRVLTGDLAYRVMIDPDWGDQVQIDTVRQAYQDYEVASLLSAGIANALDAEDHPGLIGLLRLIDPSQGAFERSLLLQSENAKPAPLVNAARAAEPRVRYEAALAATRLASGMPYAGSSRVAHCLREMQKLGEKPTAVLVETRPNIILQQELILGSMGFEVIVVPSVAGLQRCVDRGGDLRFILSKTQLADLPPVELVDMVRRIDRGADLPILFFGTDPPGLNEGRWDTPTLFIDKPASPAAFNDLLDQRAQQRRMDALSPIERSGYRDQATELLNQRS